HSHHSGWELIAERAAAACSSILSPAASRGNGLRTATRLGLRRPALEHFYQCAEIAGPSLDRWRWRFVAGCAVGLFGHHVRPGPNLGPLPTRREHAAGPECVRPIWNLTHESNAGGSGAFLGREAFQEALTDVTKASRLAFESSMHPP